MLPEEIHVFSVNARLKRLASMLVWCSPSGLKDLRSTSYLIPYTSDLILRLECKAEKFSL